MKKKGISLIEVIVSVSVFVILMITSLQIFKIILDGQKQAATTSNVQESVKYFFEVISKEIRMARINSPAACGVLENNLFKVESGNTLYLKNYHDECVVYQLVQDEGIGRFQVSRDGVSAYLTPSKISVTDLKFNLQQEVGEQAYITISISAQAQSSREQIVELTLQTSIASRNYIQP